MIRVWLYKLKSITPIQAKNQSRFWVKLTRGKVLLKQPWTPNVIPKEKNVMLTFLKTKRVKLKHGTDSSDKCFYEQRYRLERPSLA